MSRGTDQFIPEPDRFEFRADPIHKFNLARRDFFHLLGAGIAIFAVTKNAFGTQELAPQSKSFRNEELPEDISAWLHIGEDGIVTGFTGKAEIGQNIRTSLAQTIADELRVPFESVRLITADTLLTPFDAGTFGSRSTPTMTPQLRRAACGCARTAGCRSRKKMAGCTRGTDCRRRKSHRPCVGTLRGLRRTGARKNACAGFIC